MSHSSDRPVPPPVPIVPPTISYASAANVLYVSPRPLATRAVRALWVAVVAQTLLLFPALATLSVRRAYARGEEVTAWTRVLRAAGLVEIIGGMAALVSLVFWLMWVHRTYQNLRALNAEGLRYSPGWAVAYYFIPIVQLFRPFQVMRETWRASDPRHEGGTSWRNAPEPILVNVWWALELFAIGLAVLWAAFETNRSNTKAQLAAAFVDVFNTPLGVLLFVMQILIVERLTLMQDTRAGFGPVAPRQRAAGGRTGK